jgi:hypothetical protein
LRILHRLMASAKLAQLESRLRAAGIDPQSVLGPDEAPEPDLSELARRLAQATLEPGSVAAAAAAEAAPSVTEAQSQRAVLQLIGGDSNCHVGHTGPCSGTISNPPRFAGIGLNGFIQKLSQISTGRQSRLRQSACPSP